MDAVAPRPQVTPFSLKDAPSLIERIWPAQKISVEAQKERKAGSGQTLTALGSYWKGRKPLILVRACVIASLLPATGDDEKDLEILEVLCGLSDAQVASRYKSALSTEEIKFFGSPSQQDALLEGSDSRTKLKSIPRELRSRLMTEILTRMPYQARVDKLFRPEEIPETMLTGSSLEKVNEHLGTTAQTLAEIVEQLGVMRFGRRPTVGDTFCGGGSIPFEAARLGCNVLASDLNPIACMLTWGALNIVGGSPKKHSAIETKLKRVASYVENKISEMAVETDGFGNRAKAYLYCLEAKCPQTGWMVPLAPSWIISKPRNVIAVLAPDYNAKRYRIEIRANASAVEMAAAAKGTMQDGSMIHSHDGETWRTPIKTIRGDRRDSSGEVRNNLRLWSKDDIAPQPGDIYQDRLYCIQWIKPPESDGARPKTFFAAVTEDDLVREKKVASYVRKNLSRWQSEGFASDMVIETGKENEGPIRTMGWSYWHHMFNPRQLLQISLALQGFNELGSDGLEGLVAAKIADRLARNNRWDPSGEKSQSCFDNQALTTGFNYSCRAWPYTSGLLLQGFPTVQIHGEGEVVSAAANQIERDADVWVTDPPYADAVRYEEITEFFIALLRRKPPIPFRNWTWDSRRALAIKGDGEDFRKNMVGAYRAMADHMPDNGLQIVMFTHQDATVWGDMAQIFWGAGLRVMAAWYIATETTSELKKGGYVQGTVILVLRKRSDGEHGYKDEIVQEVKVEVAEQIDTMSGLNQSLRGHGRIENLFEDADLQMAGYAAALRVLTRYATIDGIDMAKEATKANTKGERSLVGEVIEFAVQVANEHMVPEGMPAKTWETLTGSERFYFKMMDIETTGAKKLDNYQNFAKAFRVANYDALMGNMEPNKATLKSGKQFKNAGFEGSEFGASKSRALLYAIYEIEKEVDGDEVLSHLRDQVPDYFNVRDDLMALAEYVAAKRASNDEEESRSAGILHGLIRNERFG